MIFQLFSDPLSFLAWSIALLAAITVHEFAHAWSAFKLGDPTAKYAGRLTLNPIAHLDPLGTLMILIAGTFGIALAVFKSRIWIFFGGSIALLILFVIFVFALLKWGMYMLFRSRGEPRRNRPSFSEIRTGQKAKGSDPEKELKKMKRKMGISD